MSTEPTDVCPQKLLLLEAYREAGAQHMNALNDLSRKIGTSSRLEYMALYRAIEILRKDAVDLHDELEFHIKQHGC